MQNNNSVMDNSNRSIIAKDDDFKVDIPEGFNTALADTWIYPVNYPLRDYQYKIVQEALLKNTLVCLPTGLGKTFIAAVVMYNVYRWYPQGKIIFMAPTKPLVKQQITACIKIFAIPAHQIAEITGSLAANKRQALWETKNVFFVTPHTLQNDLKSGIFPVSLTRLVVVDEAHHTHGKYSYVEVVNAIREKHKLFRVLALTATPGSQIEEVLEIIDYLQLNHLEIRSDDSKDLAPYIHTKDIQIIVIKPDATLKSYHEKYINIIDTYVRRLLDCGVLSGSLGSLSRGRMVMEYKHYQAEAAKGKKHTEHSQIIGDFTMCITLYHGLDLLLNHGYRIFLNFFHDNNNKNWLLGEKRLIQLRQEIEKSLGDFTLNNTDLVKVQKPIEYGHPKFALLAEVVQKHFKEIPDSRCIIFCEFRDSVILVNKLLLDIGEHVKPQVFTGTGVGGSGNDSGKGVTKPQQIKIMEQFRSGAFNVLVSTCIGEEGIDVGEVDLIICFDVSTKNPRRLVQRMGRTGRKRNGKVVILVTQGREESALKQCLSEKNSMYARIENSKLIKSKLQSIKAPKIVPDNLLLKCQQMRFDVDMNDDKLEKQNPDKNQIHNVKTKKNTVCSKKNIKKNLDLRDLFLKQAKKNEAKLKQSNKGLKRKLSADEQTIIDIDNDNDGEFSSSDQTIDDFNLEKKRKSSNEEFSSFLIDDYEDFYNNETTANKKSCEKILKKQKTDFGVSSPSFNIINEKNVQENLSILSYSKRKSDFNFKIDDNIEDVSIGDKSNSLNNCKVNNIKAFECDGLPISLAGYITKVNLNDIQNVLDDGCAFCEKKFKCSIKHFDVDDKNKNLNFLNVKFIKPNNISLKDVCSYKLKQFEKNLKCEKIEEKSNNENYSKNHNSENVSINKNEINLNETIESEFSGSDTDVLKKLSNNTLEVSENRKHNLLQNCNIKDDFNNKASENISSEEIREILSYFKLDDVLDIFENECNNDINWENNDSLDNIFQQNVFNETVISKDMQTILEPNKNSILEDSKENEKYTNLCANDCKNSDKSFVVNQSKKKLNLSVLSNIKIPKIKAAENNFSPDKGFVHNDSFNESLNSTSISRHDISDEIIKNESGAESIVEDSSSDCEIGFRKKVIKNVSKKKLQKRKSGALKFLDIEAAVSGSDDDNIDTSDDDSFVDNSFVNEEDMADVDMTKVYLQSVRSPVKVSGFKMPKRRLSDSPLQELHDTETEVFDETNNEFNSFVVKDEEVEYVDELSQLEILERKLRKKNLQKYKYEKR